MTNNQWQPCRFVEYDESLGDPRYAIIFDQFEETRSVLEDEGFMAGGYTWHGIIEYMIRIKYPQYYNEISYDPESSMFCARSSNLDALNCIVQCIRSAIAEPDTLRNAIDNADSSIIE